MAGVSRRRRGARPRLRGRCKKSEGEQALGRSRGGFSSKLHGLVDSLGNPLHFALTAGQAGDAPQALPLLQAAGHRDANALLADRAYDTNDSLEWLGKQDIAAVIPSPANRVEPRDTDWSLDKVRGQIEIMFGFMKHYRRVFSRFDKLARRYLAFVHLAAACILLR